MRLYGNDIDETTTPLEADLGWMVGSRQGEFNGAAVLREQKERGPERKLIGFELLEPGIARRGHHIYSGDTKVGMVTSGTHTPFLKKAVGMAYVSIGHAVPAGELEVDIRGRRSRARIVTMPFYKRRHT